MTSFCLKSSKTPSPFLKIEINKNEGVIITQGMNQKIWFWLKIYSFWFGTCKGIKDGMNDVIHKLWDVISFSWSWLGICYPEGPTARGCRVPIQGVAGTELTHYWYTKVNWNGLCLILSWIIIIRDTFNIIFYLLITYVDMYIFW